VEPDDPSYFEKPSHLIVENQRIETVLDEHPLPFLDWSLVQAGSIKYVDRKTAKLLPLNDPHDVTDPNDIEAVPIAIPSGIRLKAEPAKNRGTFGDVLFRPIHPWEENCTVHTLRYDTADKGYKLWYRTKDYYAYAESSDFKTWQRPLKSFASYDGHAETNILTVLNREEIAAGPICSPEEARPGQSGSFMIDPSAPAEERYKSVFLAHLKEPTDVFAQQSQKPISAMTGPGSTVLWGAVSADGIGWRVLPEPILLHDADTQTVIGYDTPRRKYVMFTRLYEQNRRTIAYAETDDFRHWPLPRNAIAPGAETGPTIDYYASAFATYPGQDNQRVLFPLVYDRAIDSSTIHLASSRDGHLFHFLPACPILRPDLSSSEDNGFMAPFPSLVRTPDHRMLLFYDVHRTPHKFPRHRFAGSHHYAATWPADRLAALEAAEKGSFTSVPLLLRGSHIVLNMQSERTGGIELEIRDATFTPIPGYTFADNNKMIGDHPAITASWNGKTDLAHLRGKTIYLSFRLQAARLYAISTPTD
jgi:hypothetical protein